MCSARGRSVQTEAKPHPRWTLVGVAAVLVAVAAADAGGLTRAGLIRPARTEGRASVIVGSHGALIAMVPDPETAPSDPQEFLERFGPIFGLSDAARRLTRSKVHTDSLGHTHTTYQQIHEGIPVFSGVLKVHQSADGRVILANGRIHSVGKNMALAPRISALEAEAAARSRLPAGLVDVATATVERNELVIVDPGWYGDPPTGPQLAYHVILSVPPAVVREAYFVEARTGEIIDRWSMIHTLRDRRIHDALGTDALPGLLVRAEGDDPHGTFDVDAAYDFVGDTYDYLFRAFGRDSLDGLGMPLIATVNSTTDPCPNARWNGTQVLFCEGTVTDDIVAHELTHGLTELTAGLIYQNQSGQLNEAFSDIFGELVDLFNGDAAFAGPPGGLPWPTHATGSGTDTPNDLRDDTCDGAVRWMIGEDGAMFGGAVRDMWNPTCFNDPDRAGSALQTCFFGDDGGVHAGSGIANHAFAMLTDGKTFNGYTVSGIGPIKAGAIWYRALTIYLTPSSDFQDAYFAIVQAATDLIGTAPNDPRTGDPSESMITETDLLQVEKSLRAVEMDTGGSCGHSGHALVADDPVRCQSASVVFSTDFEDSAEGWSVSNSGPPTPYDWIATTKPLPVDRPGVARLIENRSIGDCDVKDERATHSLISPPIQVTRSAGQSLRLSFLHYVRTEGSLDGGNLKVRVDGGDWRLVTRDAQVHNPYNGALFPASKGNTNPLAGQPVWTGLSAVWGTSVVNLTDYVEPGTHTVEVMFEFGKDGCGGVTGWYVDDVELYLCPDCDASGTAEVDQFRFTFASPPLWDVGSGSVKTYVIPSPPPSGSDVIMSFSGVGDFLDADEFMTVSINGKFVGGLFQLTAVDCPLSPDTDQLIVDPETFNSAVAGGDAVIELKATSAVSADRCQNGSYVTVFVKYNATEQPRNDPTVMTATNRYLSFTLGNSGRPTAIKVTLVDLPPPFDVRNGEVRWAGEPFAVSENAGLSDATPPLINVAHLICEPFIRDWGDTGTLHLFGEDVVPGGVYAIQAVEEACGAVLVATDAPALNLVNSAWGDVAGPFDPVAEQWTGPDQRVDVVTDILAVLDKFSNRPNAPSKVRCDVEPTVPDQRVNISDMTHLIEAFRSRPYPFTPATVPCSKDP